jgi:hypothetical protein
MLVWPKYSSGSAIISEQTAEALATAHTSARRFRQRGREEPLVSFTLAVALRMIMGDEFGQGAPE